MKLTRYVIARSREQALYMVGCVLTEDTPISRGYVRLVFDAFDPAKAYLDRYPAYHRGERVYRVTAEVTAPSRSGSHKNKEGS